MSQDGSDELAGELRRLFAGLEGRLDVPVRPDATTAIVAGARRLRRRRAGAMIGAVVALAVAGAGIAVARRGRG